MVDNTNPKDLPKKGLFEKRSEGLSRSEFRQVLRKTSYDPNVKMMRDQRVKMEKELFPQKYGSNISKRDVDKRLLLLNKEKTRTPHTQEKLKIQHEMNLLGKLKNQKLK